MKKPTRPTSIMILSTRYEIRWMDEMTEILGACNGACMKDQQIIAMAPNLNPTAMADVFLHEVIHSVYKALGLDGDSKEECVALRLSTGLCTVWQQNPAVFWWWANLMEV